MIQLCRSKRRSGILGTLAVLLSWGIPVYAQTVEVQTDPMIRYIGLNGRGKFGMSFTVRIWEGGKASVEIERKQGESVAGKTTTPMILDADEMAALNAVIDACGIFSEPPEPVNSGLVDCLIDVRRGGEYREVAVDAEKERGPLVRFLRSIVIQADQLQTLKRGEITELAPLLAPDDLGGGVLQPYAFHDSLRAFINTTTDDEELRRALAAFAVVAPAGEWAGVVAGEFDVLSDTRVAMLARMLADPSFTERLSKGHRDALNAVFVRYLRTGYKDWSKLPPLTRSASVSVIRSLGDARYYPAIRIFAALIPAAAKETVDASRSDVQPTETFDPEAMLPILEILPGVARYPHYTPDVVQAVLPYLDDKDQAVRAIAVAIFRVITECDPNAPPNPIPREQQKQILGYLRENVAPKLKVMAEKDQAEWPRNAARRALEELDRAWGVEEEH